MKILVVRAQEIGHMSIRVEALESYVRVCGLFNVTR